MEFMKLSGTQRRSALVLLLLATVPATGAIVLGQGNAAATAPSFDVISIKQSQGDSNSGGIMDRPDGFSMKSLPLRPLISEAFGTRMEDEITGWPGWAASARFDIEAKMDAETADALHRLPRQQQEAQRQAMLQGLLADRFQLKVHHTSTVRTTYELILAKGGSKLKEDDAPIAEVKAPEGTRRVTDWMSRDGSMTGHAMPISILVNTLQWAAGGRVVDKTGLTGRYDVSLQWDSTDGRNPSATEPTILVAVQEQLGLRLQPVKAAVDTIVIDHLEMPSAN